jgi:beta-galactosidase
LQDYWDYIESKPNLQGGYIWDWKNQTLNRKTADGKAYWAWAYDFEPEFMSPDIGCSDGLVFADGTPEPAMQEVKKVYQHIKFKNFDAAKGSLTIRNAHFFRNLNNYTFSYQILKDGISVKEGILILPANVKPQEEINITIPDFAKNTAHGTPFIGEGGEQHEFYLNIYAQLKTDEPLLKKGYILASEQFLIAAVSPTLAPAKKVEPKTLMAIDTGDNGFTWITAQDFVFVFDRKTGFLNRWQYKGKELLKEPLVPDFWRVPVNNDLGNNMQKRCAVWRNAPERLKIKQFEALAIEGYVKVNTSLSMPDTKTELVLNYMIGADGSLRVDYDFKTDSDTKAVEIPRIGMRLVTFGGYENWTWYGRGPHENYWDRNTSSFVGLYNGKVKDQFVPYEVPQENGAKTDVRWCRLTDNRGFGFQVKALGSFLDVNAQNYRQADMEGKKHPYEVPLSNLVELHIDHRQMGIGGDNSWELLPMEKYLLRGQTYRYAFVLQPTE